jgi:hypothetical protein
MLLRNLMKSCEVTCCHVSEKMSIRSHHLQDRRSEVNNMAYIEICIELPF